MARSRTTRHALALALLALGLVCAGARAFPGGIGPSPQDRAHELWKEGAGLHLEGKYHSAVQRFREALALRRSARTYTYLAWSLSELDDHRAAVQLCRRAIELDPDYPNAYNDLGAYLVTLDRPRAAERWLRRALEFDDYCCPHYAYYHLGKALLLQGRVNDARQALEASLRHNFRYRPARELLQFLRAMDLRGA